MPSADTLRLQTNIPEVIALAFSQGKAVHSEYSGDQVMYSLVDGRRMYLPPFVAQKIESAGISARVPFAIVKKEVTHGNRRTVEYQIQTPNDTNHNAAAAPSQDATPVTAASSKAEATMSSPQDSAPSDPDTAAMIAAHKRAVDVAAAAEAYASERGLAIRYAAEDIRAIAATLYIQQAKGGAR